MGQLVQSVAKWNAGDAALAEAPMGDTGINTNAHEALRALAAAAGIEFNALRGYRDVAHAWPEGTRVPSASWSVHRELIGFVPPGTSPEVDRVMMAEARSRWLKDFIAMDAATSGVAGKVPGRVTTNQVRQARGLRPKGYQPEVSAPPTSVRVRHYCHRSKKPGTS